MCSGGLQPAIFQDPEVSETDVSLLLARKHTPEPDTKATRFPKAEVLGSIFSLAVNRRTGLIF